MGRFWKDRVVEKPRTFNIQNNPDGTITLIPAPGTILEAGTPVNAVNLNGLEEDLETHKADKTQHINPLVQEIIVSSPVTFITFDNLDGNSDGGYFLIAEVVSSASSNSHINLFVENDQVPTNYQGGAGISSYAPSDGASFIVSSTGFNLSYCDINISQNGVFNLVSFNTRIGGQLGSMTREKKTPITNITRLDIVQTVVGTINAGSRFRLYRRKNG